VLSAEEYRPVSIFGAKAKDISEIKPSQKPRSGLFDTQTIDTVEV